MAKVLGINSFQKPEFLVYQHPFILKVDHKRKWKYRKCFKKKLCWFDTRGDLLHEETTDLPSDNKMWQGGTHKEPSTENGEQETPFHVL